MTPHSGGVRRGGRGVSHQHGRGAAASTTGISGSESIVLTGCRSPPGLVWQCRLPHAPQFLKANISGYGSCVVILAGDISFGVSGAPSTVLEIFLTVFAKMTYFLTLILIIDGSSA